MDVTRHHVGPRLSQIAVVGDLIFLAGQVPDNATGRKCADQARQVLDKIERYLAEVGSNKSNLVQVTVYLADLKYLNDFNRVWDEWIPAGHTPPRACVHAALVNSDWLVEVVVIAARSAQGGASVEDRLI
jgi:enamine deaminase RidA (YjgF/YER057c/UK114 family)